MIEIPGLRSRFRGALIGVAIGDGAGAPYEGAFRVRDKDLERLRTRPGRLRYTDDTHMTIGLAESLVERGEFDGDHTARTFARNYAAEPWRGYGAGPPQVFRMIEQGIPWNEAGRTMFGGQGSYGNGAAMRVAPAALAGYGDPDRIAEIARLSAIITHAHPLGVEGAVLQAQAVALSIEEGNAGNVAEPGRFLKRLEARVADATYRERLSTIRELLNEGDPRSAVGRLGNGIAAIEAVPAALYAFLWVSQSFGAVVTAAIKLGGDTDTIAAMAGALAGANLGEESIPEIWRENAEGVDRLRSLADQLLGSRE